MARTPLLTRLLGACELAVEASLRNVPAEEVVEERHVRRMSRRAFLRSAGAIGAAAALGARVTPAQAASAPRIVVVGAGLAGLTCAYRLRQAGYRATVYEASNRVGGRCWSLRGFFDDGQIAEHGGELIDQGHTQIRQLAQELGLTLDNLLQAETNGTAPFYYFDGAPYPYVTAVDDLKGIWQTLHKDVSAASYPTLYNSYTQRGYELDHMSVVDWINVSVPGGLGSRLGQLLDIAYNIEYGAESSEQSALNLLYLLGYSGQGQLRIFGPSNEKYRVRGGNDQIASRLADTLAGQIVAGTPLTAIRRNGDGTYQLSFQGAADVTADQVVLALPFSMLRAGVDYSKAGFNKVKRDAIAKLGMGTNSKLHLQFRQRVWNALGSNGETYADTGYQNTWEVTRAQAGTSGILIDYTGGRIGASFGTGTPAERASQFLAQIEPVLPGLSAAWNGKATVDFWAAYPWTLGSYSYWKVGQYTSFAGAEREQSGACHFAGEHTSVDFQGYLNGAVESGERAANEILAAYKSAVSATALALA
jgi:monoamine oxidase